VTQDTSLLHRSVADNILYGRPGATRAELERAAQRAHADEFIASLSDAKGRTGFDAHVGERGVKLSGGQRQRIALARALAVEPRVLLLDEPFGALDAKVRKELRSWLRRLHDELHITSIFVTHDQDEALEVADRIVLMDHGRVEQVGTPQEVYERPATPFVYGFLGAANRFVGRAHEGVLHIGEHQLPGAGSGAG
ncbi:sulfate/molybdate ABC transporter ATP-binding protein, partial [Escherichia coli]|uniref:sulfate/molybdate ABC transporter ATP-binding protein n=1 Tax=Escherichia coli TaxID=562 RepID=UPI00192A4D36